MCTGIAQNGHADFLTQKRPGQWCQSHFNFHVFFVWPAFVLSHTEKYLSIFCDDCPSWLSDILHEFYVLVFEVIICCCRANPSKGMLPASTAYGGLGANLSRKKTLKHPLFSTKPLKYPKIIFYIQ